jgi:hypothetical protein
MRELNLTQNCVAARSVMATGEGRNMKKSKGWAVLAGPILLGASGCINVAAPEEPIVIELNVNIEARLLVELAEDANNTIEENSDIF